MHRFNFMETVTRNLKKMGLQILYAGVDYHGSKPDIVIVYPNKNKYYLAEVISEECLKSPLPRLASKGEDSELRRMCRILYPEERTASWAAAVYCDLALGLDLFVYNELKSYTFATMSRYGAVIYPAPLLKEAEKMFYKFQLQFQSLDVAGKFNLTLFSRNDTEKLKEVRRFMQYMAANREL